MSVDKRYGLEGPPQLHDRTEDAPREVLEAWLSTGADCVESFRDDEWWRKRVRCQCGGVDAFTILRADASHDQWISGKFGGRQRTELTCGACGRDMLLFDDGLHGYNAVVCNDRDHLSADYEQANRRLLQRLPCRCGQSQFSIIVEVMYDCDEEDLESIPSKQWDDAYGSFAATARCSNCGDVQEIVDAETA